jgi:hypothetical protein
VKRSWNHGRGFLSTSMARSEWQTPAARISQRNPVGGADGTGTSSQTCSGEGVGSVGDVSVMLLLVVLFFSHSCMHTVSDRWGLNWFFVSEVFSPSVHGEWEIVGGHGWVLSFFCLLGGSGRVYGCVFGLMMMMEVLVDEIRRSLCRYRELPCLDRLP